MNHFCPALRLDPHFFFWLVGVCTAASLCTPQRVGEGASRVDITYGSAELLFLSYVQYQRSVHTQVTEPPTGFTRSRLYSTSNSNTAAVVVVSGHSVTYPQKQSGNPAYLDQVDVLGME